MPDIETLREQETQLQVIISACGTMIERVEHLRTGAEELFSLPPTCLSSDAVEIPLHFTRVLAEARKARAECEIELERVTEQRKAAERATPTTEGSST